MDVRDCCCIPEVLGMREDKIQGNLGFGGSLAHGGN